MPLSLKLVDLLREQGAAPRLLWTRVGYTPVFNAAKSLARRILGRGGALPPIGHSERRTRMFRRPAVRRLWMTIGLLDLTLTYAVLLRWWRARGRVVICDRYLWDSLVDLEINHGEAGARLTGGATSQPRDTPQVKPPSGENGRQGARRATSKDCSPGASLWRLREVPGDAHVDACDALARQECRSLARQ